MTHHHRRPGVLAYLAGAFAFGVVRDFMTFQRRGNGEQRPDVVDVAGEESFPASDAPPWTAGRDPVAEL